MPPARPITPTQHHAQFFLFFLFLRKNENFIKSTQRYIDFISWNAGVGKGVIEGWDVIEVSHVS